MAMNVKIECTAADGTTLEVLEQLVQRRAQVMNETALQSCIAITINCLKSIRAATRKNKGKIKPPVDVIQGDLDISVKEAPQYVVSFMKTSKVPKPCIRAGSKRGPIVDIKPWWRINLSQVKTAKVYEVRLSEARQQAWKFSTSPWYMVAQSLEDARGWATTRYNKIAQRYSGLGKDALSRAMSLVSDRPSTIITGDKTYQVLQNNVIVQKSLDNANSLGTSGSYYIHIEDNLRYAGDALKGGYSVVNSALMRAANSTNAIINSWVNRRDPLHFFNDTQEKPFPPEAFQDN